MLSGLARHLEMGYKQSLIAVAGELDTLNQTFRRSRTQRQAAEEKIQRLEQERALWEIERKQLGEDCKREKEARLAREVAKARAQGDDLDDVDPELDGALAGKNGKNSKKRRRDEDDGSGSGSGSGDEGAEDGYYELVQRKSKEKKEKKKAEYEAAKAAER